MNNAVYVAIASLVAGCAVVHARTARTGHLIVSLTDRETGEPITNAMVKVRVQTKRSIGGHSAPQSSFAISDSKADSHGVANVKFKFYYSDFDWWVRSPTHYCHRYRLGARNEWLRGVIDESDYRNIDTNTVQGLAMYNELLQLDNNVVIRSASFYPKRNPRPMYAYGENYDLYLSMKTSAIVTNGMEVMRYAPVDFDMKECLPVSYDPNHDDSWDGPAGKVADFRIERFKVITNGVTTTYGWIEFAPGCGAYKRSTTGDDSFPTTYEADTNEVFVSRIPFECSSVSGKVVRIERILERGEYMVLRTRVATNDVGAVTSCNYSKILGPMFVSDHWYPRDHVSFQSMIFNPEPNDPNLEADLRSNLATRGYGSWYP